MSQYRFAELVESVAQATVDCYVGDTFNSITVAKIQADMRERFEKMFAKINNPISNLAAEWLADEHLKLASINGKQTIEEMNVLIKSIHISQLSTADIAMLKKLFPSNISVIGEKLV